jgi:PTH1 family peptidyl-tRNA hydrolase
MRARLKSLFAARTLSYRGLTSAVFGLGNPGEQYRDTRHNVGWQVLETLAAQEALPFRRGRGDFRVARWSRPEGDALLVLPDTFMNLSGLAGRRITTLSGLAPEDCLVVLDDMELPLGRLRLRGSGGSGGHRGLASLIESWENENFPRLRLGIGRPPAEATEHVLAPFTEEELDTARKMIEAAADAVRAFLSRGLEPTMSRFNALQIG